MASDPPRASSRWSQRSPFHAITNPIKVNFDDRGWWATPPRNVELINPTCLIAVRWYKPLIQVRRLVHHLSIALHGPVDHWTSSSILKHWTEILKRAKVYFACRVLWADFHSLDLYNWFVGRKFSAVLIICIMIFFLYCSLSISSMFSKEPLSFFPHSIVRLSVNFLYFQWLFSFLFLFLLLVLFFVVLLFLLEVVVSPKI